jgi:uncharacterized protein YbbC (DUF1343 family)
MRFVLMLLFLLLGCGSASSEQSAPSSDTVAPDTSAVRTGAQVLADRGFDLLDGRRVGLIVNHTARVDTVHLIDAVDATSGVTLAVLFGPEHGLRGTADAGETVSDGVDDRTGAPVYSLYGQTRKPTPEMLDGLDVLVFDIQDVGARFYTYISTMGLAMQAAAEADLPFVVLDRPNPLGGVLVSGFVLEPEQTSFVGQYPIPVAHGLTVGELAQMIKGEGWLPGLENLDLTVVPVEDWQRPQRWPATGLPWIPPSPNIPDVETAFVYPGTCLFEATGASEGRGTREPFRLLGAPWADGQALVDTLTARTLPGVRFTPAPFTPESIEGMASNPKLEGVPLGGIRLHVVDPSAYRPVATGIHVLHAFYHQAQRAGEAFVTRPDWMDKLAGTERLREMLTAGATPEAIVAAWQAEVDAFAQRRTPYLLY